MGREEIVFGNIRVCKLYIISYKGILFGYWDDIYLDILNSVLMNLFLKVGYLMLDKRDRIFFELKIIVI